MFDTSEQKKTQLQQQQHDHRMQIIVNEIEMRGGEEGCCPVAMTMT